MKKRILLAFMVLIISFQTLFYQPYQASAVGADTVLKLVGGKAVVRALAEKAGMALSKKQVDNVAGFIEKKTYDGDSKAIDFVNKANNLTGTPSTSGFKKYVLDPASWLLGLDLIMLAVSAFQMGYDNGETVPIYGQCIKPVEAGTNPFIVYIPDSSPQITKMWVFHEDVTFTDEVKIHSTNGTAISSSGYTSYDNGATWTKTDSTMNRSTPMSVYRGSNTIVNYTGFPCGSVISMPVEQTDIVNTTNVSSSVINHFNNDTYNQNTTYNIEIEIPDVPNYDDMTPWNEPDPLLGEAIDPIKPDSDGDGLADDIDPFPNDPSNIDPAEKPVGSSWWEWLLGPLKAIGDFFKDIGGFLLGILVPSADTVTGVFDGISDSFKAKIPIADQLGTFFGEIEEIQANESPIAPTFDVTMPAEWGGGTFPMIDFSYFDQWRTWVLNFIRFTAWFIFLKKLYARIPRMVY